jgi:hypothetical protein
MRSASIRMSWLAEAKATSTAAMVVAPGAVAGLVCARARMAATSASCTGTSQPRLRPRRSGGGSLSSSGAHRNFSE